MDTLVTTPTARRLGIDVARILALVAVVLGHLALAVVDRAGGDIRGANLLALRPGWTWIAALAPMPVFFAAGGWANATSTLRAAAPRLRTLVGLGAVVVVTWSSLVVVATVMTGDPGMLAKGARVATQPLWFLAAYVPFAAFGGPLARLAGKHPVLAIGGCLATLGGLDLLRFGLDAPQWLAWPGFYAAWVVPWLLGAWWRERATSGDFDEQAAGAALLLTAGAAGSILVNRWGYSPALIDAVPGARSNTTPPTLYTAVAGVAQVGGLMLGGSTLDRLGRRWRRLWSQAGEAAVGIYLWHLSALAVAVALLAAGLPTPERLTGLWWATRPLWWVLILAITAAFLAATNRVLAPEGSTPPRPSGARTERLVAGVVVTAVAAALLGLEGPTSVRLAVLCSAAMIAGWYLLGGATAPPSSSSTKRRTTRSSCSTSPAAAHPVSG